MPPVAIHPLATVDATLNATATVLLVLGWILIKRRQEQAHKWTMIAAFGVSAVFLACYLTYHITAEHTPFRGQGIIRPIYFTILISHIALAATVPVLAGRTLYLGLKDRRDQHRRWAKWTMPIWLYVSVTGVVVYVMLYHLYRTSG
jgi:putative membrane protein